MDPYENYKKSFNNYPTHRPNFVLRPEKYCGLNASTTNCTVRGLGGSYGDAALSKNGYIILTERLDRFVNFDEEQGIICVEAGISLAKILDVIIGYGWFLPVTPGTSNVTLGGCVAMDVHGKNHYHESSIGQHVLALELIIASGERIKCSPTDFPELFWATIGGMGLTGVIGTITLKLKKVESAYLLVQYQTANDLAETFDCFFKKSLTYDYAVAWLDALNLPLGRSIIMHARHASLEVLSLYQKHQPFICHSYKTYQLPFYLPSGLINQKFIKTCNKIYYKKLSKKKYPFISFYKNYFYPLEGLAHWPRLYGKRGFIQYQCVVPSDSACSVITQILTILNKQKYPACLAVLKKFGLESLAPLSFPLAGFSLAVDIPIINQGLFDCLENLDAMVIAAGGRVYLAKDARLKPQAFRAMYPRYHEWLAVKKKWDSKNKFTSNLARRLEIYCP